MDKTKEQLLQENNQLRQRIFELEASEEKLLKIKEDLKEQKEKYKVAFEHTGTAMLIVEEDMTILMANNKLEEVTGYNEKVGKGKKWTEFVEEEDIEKLKEYHFKRRKDPDSVPEEYEVRLKHTNKKYKDFLINVSMIPGTKKSLFSLINITHRKRMENTLKDSEQRFRETADLLPGVICEMDFNMSFTYVNNRGLEIFGYSREEFEKGVNAASVIYDQDKERAVQGFTSVLSGDYIVPREYRMVKKNGTVINTLVNSSPIHKDNKICGIRSCIIDISQLKKTQEMLKNSEERFRSIFSQAPISIALFMTNGQIVEKNRSFIKMFNLFHMTEKDNNSYCIFNYLDINQYLLKNLKKGESIYRESEIDFSGLKIEIANKKKDGVRYLIWHIIPLGDKGMNPSLFLAHVQDVTEQKLAKEAQLRKAREETEKANRIVEGLKKEILFKARFHNIISRSPKMNEIFKILPEMAQTTATVLISGKSGTGKELIARSLHELGLRNSKPFVAINCGALPENLLEAELFGYKAGAFTDAKKDKIGKFAAAEGGTILFDEIGDISKAMQVKLLRVLQERTYEPLGSVTPITANVRIIAATNKDIVDMVKKGFFREDLFYRINVLNIELPPLKDRLCDVPLLCDYFINNLNSRYLKNIKGISQNAIDILLDYHFPGNIRELENLIERAFILCKDDAIQIEHLTDKIKPKIINKEIVKSISSLKGFKEVERFYIESVLNATSGDKLMAAKKMGIHKATLYRKIKEHDIANDNDLNSIKY